MSSVALLRKIKSKITLRRRPTEQALGWVSTDSGQPYQARVPTNRLALLTARPTGPSPRGLYRQRRYQVLTRLGVERRLRTQRAPGRNTKVKVQYLKSKKLPPQLKLYSTLD